MILPVFKVVAIKIFQRVSNGGSATVFDCDLPQETRIAVTGADFWKKMITPYMWLNCKDSAFP